MRLQKKKIIKKCLNQKNYKFYCFEFFIFGARLAFIKLKQIFINTLIFYYFDLEYHI